jgi:hypothetical protein
LAKTFNEHSHIFSNPQQKLWSELGEQLADHWILYGDTAIGLRMGHRYSLDFEFKSARHFNPEHLQETMPFLRDSKVLESRWSFLKVAVGGPTPVEMTFAGGQTMAQIHPPDQAQNRVHVASLADLAGEKIFKVSQQFTEKHGRDMAELLYAGTSMDEMLRCAEAKYGEQFDSSAAILNLSSADRSDVHLDQEDKSAISRESVMARFATSRMPIHSERLTTETCEPARAPERKQNYQRGIDPHDLRDPFDLGPER